MHETESEGFGCREEPETGAWRRLVLYVWPNTIGVKRRRRLALAVDRNDPTQWKLGRATQMCGLPAVQEFFAAHQAQRPVTFVEKTFLPQLAYETEGAHHGDLSRGRKLRSVAIFSPRRAKNIFGKQGREQDLEHPLAEIGEQVRRLGRRELLSMCPAGRCGIEFFETRPDEVPEAFAVEDADCNVGRELGEKTDQALCGARRDSRGADDGERRCRFGKCLGIGSFFTRQPCWRKRLATRSSNSRPLCAP